MFISKPIITSGVPSQRYQYGCSSNTTYNTAYNVLKHWTMM